MKYKVLRGLTVRPFNLPYVAGNVLDTAKDKVDKEIIDLAIQEKRIRPIEEVENEDKAAANEAAKLKAKAAKDADKAKADAEAADKKAAEEEAKRRLDHNKKVTHSSFGKRKN